MVESWSDELAGRELDQTAFSSAIEPSDELARRELDQTAFSSAIEPNDELAGRELDQTAFSSAIEPNDELARRELDQTAFSSAIEPVVKFAQFLLHPLSFVEPSRLRLGPFSAEQVLTFAKAPAFYDPIEKGLIKEFGLNRVEISPSFVTGLSSLPSARIAVILLTSSLVDLDTFSLNLTGVILSKDIVRVVLKTERECLLTSLGSDAFSIAIHEAPVLYRGMDGLATESDMPVTDLIGTREKALCYGYQVIAGFLRAQSPALSDLFYLRVPYPQDEWDDGRVLSEKQVNLLVSRFVKRGYPSWVSYTD